MSANTTTENIVPLFKTFAELQQDEKQIMEDYFDEWESAYQTFDAKSSIVSKSDAPLTKRLEPIANLVASLKAAIAKRDERLYGHSALAKRSIRFAMAHELRNSSEADKLPPAS